MAKTSLHTHTAVVRLPGVSYIAFLVSINYRQMLIIFEGKVILPSITCEYIQHLEVLIITAENFVEAYVPSISPALRSVCKQTKTIVSVLFP